MAQTVDRESLIRTPVTGISGVWRFSREPAGHRQARSLPGHLLHLVLKGSYRLRTNGREYRIRPHDVIYYHETESVDWLGNDEEVVFYSVGFLAPQLDPLPPARRVFPSNMAIRRAFEDLYAASLKDRGVKRSLELHCALLRIVVEIDWGGQTVVGEAGGRAELWWRIERLVRERHMFRPSLEELSALTRRSRASVVRACRAATGTSPMRRLRAERMAEARGLLLSSSLNITQVADYLGYGRVHEFSRDFASFFGHPPTAVRPGRKQ
ncbi:MAG: hypothetical protein C0404_01185 [Verrucomicrobia bacterium]|nr:hypothetical protein [Verrucomicrobiota bacterium]